jgi:hypothetical protein
MYFNFKGEKMKLFLKLLVAISFFVTISNASSEASFPTNWKSFNSVNTPLAGIGALPDCNADVSTLPPIYQETVATYCAVKPGGPGAVEILASSTSAFKKRSGNYKDGTTFILHLKDLKILFVTQWKNNKPLYGIYTENGQDAANVVGSGLNPKDCRACHTGYGAFCINGQCATAK